ncbi:MAG TPA: arylsulfatase [Bacteroides sp.]|nr:arylsulfatase [Bacteroides sp.]
MFLFRRYKILSSLLIAISFLPGLEASVKETGDSQASRPNIIILLADDLGWGDLACYGNENIRTPALDKLSAEGILFTDAYSSAPMCSPSRAGLLTGRNPGRAGIYDWIAPDSSHYLKKDEVTISRLLNEDGYQTAICGKWHLNGTMGVSEQSQPDDHGFDYSFATQFSSNHLAPTGFYRNGEKLYRQNNGYSCDIVTNDAINWLENSWDGESPFFQFVSFHEVHEPIASPPDLLVEYSDAGKKMVYYANVANLDRAIGNYLSAIEEMGLKENTIVIFTSDNGPAPWSKGYFERSYGETGGLKGRKRYLWEGGIRVPCLIRWPATIPAGQINDVPVSNVDFLPTLAGICGIDIPVDLHIDGSDISSLLTGKEFDRELPLNWHFYGPFDGPNSVLRSGDWIITASWNGGMYSRGRFTRSWISEIKSAELTDFKLYNIREEISQETDLKNEYPEVYKRLKQELILIHHDVREDSPFL